MKTEREKMIAGEYYIAGHPDLRKDRTNAKKTITSLKYY